MTERIPYVKLEVQLFNCVRDVEEVEKEIKTFLIGWLNPEVMDDVDVYMTESAGLK